MRRIALIVVCWLALCASPLISEAAIKALATVRTVTFDGTNLIVDIGIQIVGAPHLGIQRTFVAANIADNTVILAGIRTHVINFAQNQHGITLVAGEIAVIGSPL